jgi:hypothetical protein
MAKYQIEKEGQDNGTYLADSQSRTTAPVQELRSLAMSS